MRINRRRRESSLRQKPNYFHINGENLDIDSVWSVAQGQQPARLHGDCVDRLQKSRDYVEGFIEQGETVYGVNTGFGALSDVKISDSQLEELQRNLVRSHSVGVGEPFTPEETRAILLLRANALSRGHSGVRVQVIEKILEFINKDILPVVPCQGSVGASGDLAPLAHVALSLMGEGECFHKGKRQKTSTVLRKLKVSPLKLQAKEGLSLMNGCQVMTAVGLLNAYEARRLNWMTDIAGSMSLEALKGSRKAFDPLIAATRPHPGEAITARNLLKVMGPVSSISKSHIDCNRVQDAYSLRCMPQVHGAAKDTFRHVLKVLETEANSSTDNPLVFHEEDKVLSCGNFHGEPVAFAMDFMGIATAAMASISECRIEKLTNTHMSGLPPFLAKDGGLNSGMMIVQVAAASLVSENKILSHPASVDSIPTSADKEDHVSMGTIAARKLGQIVKNGENVCAMEILCAAQALDLNKPLKPSHGVKKAYECVRDHVPFAQKDRAFYEDIATIRGLIRSGELLEAVTDLTGVLEI